MGFDCELRKIFAFIYKAEVDQHLVEHEYDHVFAGAFDGTPAPSVLEVSDWKWMAMKTLARDIEARPRHYTSWLKVALEEFKSRHLYGI